MRGALLLAALLVLAMGHGLRAQDSPFGEGWSLVPGLSSLTFLSTKNTDVVETNKFTSISGAIDTEGNATVKVQLNSIDTGIDLRNVRMRFLFFETFKFPEMTISAAIDPALVADLATVRRKRITMPFAVDLHGTTETIPVEVVLTAIMDDQVSVAAAAPVQVEAALFGLEAGVQRLQEAAGVTLLPAGAVSFDLVFQRGAGTETEAAVIDPRTTAVETAGTLSEEECIGRFEIMSKAEAIFFASGSARLDEESRHLLDEVVGIVGRCPGLSIQISGHTDARGSDGANQLLSERRAAAVEAYLVDRGVSEAHLEAKGFGETIPAFPNDSPDHRARNRRIEFSVLR